MRCSFVQRRPIKSWEVLAIENVARLRSFVGDESENNANVHLGVHNEVVGVQGRVTSVVMTSYIPQKDFLLLA
jgi:hypothetical protein